METVKRLVFFIAVIPVITFAHVKQEWVARYSYQENDRDSASALAVDSYGNVFVTGKSMGSDSTFDYATVKYNSEGREQWATRYNGSGDGNDKAYAIAVDSRCNIYVTGMSDQPNSYGDYATIKYNPRGKQKWIGLYNGTGNIVDDAFFIALDSEGNVYVTGESRILSTEVKYAVVKYNSRGKRQWAARFNSFGLGRDWFKPRASAVDASGNVYATGSDYITVKYNTQGRLEWAADYICGENGYGDAHGIALDSAGNVYVTGFSKDSVGWGDYATIKYDPQGRRQWVARYDGTAHGMDWATAVAVDAPGNVYVTGYSYGYSDRLSTGFDYVTIKYNTQGKEEWLARYNGPVSRNDKPGRSTVKPPNR